ncbi:MAG: hypothetical protein KIS78_20655 [Labilithrix sp.]|nr:hypothetical protein [Labilithrix sp.]MCW5834828.1 hypothetical protein [Labilithrix sp.]
MTAARSARSSSTRPASRPRGRRAHAVAALAACAIAATACARRALVALPSTASAWVDPFTARTTSQRGVTVEASTDARRLARLDLGGRATPVLVRVANGGDVPLDVSRASFELVAGTARFGSIPPDRFAGARPDLHRRELRSGALEPGESREGVVYFEPVVGDWGFVNLRASLVDASSAALLGTIDVPFSSGREVRCTLDDADRREPPSPEAFLFRGCLPPP